MFTKESNYNPRFWEKKSAPLCGIFNKYKEKLSVPREQTAALSLKQQHHNASIQLNSKVYPSELLSVSDQRSIVLKHNTEIVNDLQIVRYTL